MRLAAAIASSTLGCAGAALSEKKRMAARQAQAFQQGKRRLDSLLVLPDFGRLSGLSLSPLEVLPQRCREPLLAFLVFPGHANGMAIIGKSCNGLTGEGSDPHRRALPDKVLP